MAEKERMEDDEGRSTGDCEEGDQQQSLRKASTAPYFKWKVFVRGDESTLQGRSVCDTEEENEENISLTSAQDGDVTRSFYESVVRQADTSKQRDTNRDRYRDRLKDKHRKTDASRPTETNRSINSHKLRHTDTFGDKETGRHMDRHRETDPNTNTPTRTEEAASTSRTAQATITQDKTQYPRLPPTYNLPLGPQDTHTALRFAQTNQTAALSTLLDQGLNVNTKDSYGWSFLMVAACAGATDTVRMLITRGARTGFRDARGNTALYLATVKGHREVTEILIKANKRRVRRADERTRHEEEEEEEEGYSSSTETLEDEYFCEVCEVMVKERERERHRTSIVHQFKMKAGPTTTQYGIPPSNRGYQLLVGQGWDTEGGLGSEKQGLKFPLKTVLKRDRKGFGAGGELAPRVTHFGPGDASAVKRRPQETRVERPATLNRREMKKKKMQEQKEEIKLRRMLNEPDY